MPTKITQNGRKKINVAGTIHSNSQEVSLVGHTHNIADINQLEGKIREIAASATNSANQAISPAKIKEAIKEIIPDESITYTPDEKSIIDIRDKKAVALYRRLETDDSRYRLVPDVYHIVLGIGNTIKNIVVKLTKELSSVNYNYLINELSLLEDGIDISFGEIIDDDQYNAYLISINKTYNKNSQVKILSITHFGKTYIPAKRPNIDSGIISYEATFEKEEVDINWSGLYDSNTNMKFMSSYKSNLITGYSVIDINSIESSIDTDIVKISYYPNKGFIATDFKLSAWKISLDENGEIEDVYLYKGSGLDYDINTGSNTYNYIFSSKYIKFVRNSYYMAEVYDDYISIDHDRNLKGSSVFFDITNKPSGADDINKWNSITNIIYLIKKYILKSIKETPAAPELTGRINGVLFNGKQDINITVPSLSTNHTINGVAFNGTQDITITARAAGGNADTLGNLRSDQYVKVTDVANAAGKIPRFNASGHLVYPDGHEEWIE